MTLPAPSPRQSDVLDVIRQHQADHGYSPSLAEIAIALGISRTPVHQHLKALERKGWITADRNRAIAIIDGKDQGR